MKKRLLSILLALSMVAALLPGTAWAKDSPGAALPEECDVLSTAIGSGSGKYTVKIGGYNDYDSAYEIFESLNSYRKANGLSALTMDKDLMAAAMQRAAETAIYYSHTRPDNSSCFTVFPGRLSSGTRRENIALGYTSADAVMNGWKNSSGHNANMLADSNRSVGVGAFVDGNGTRYWVQLFASASGTAESVRTAGVKAVTANITAAGGVLNVRVSPDSATLRAGETAIFTARNTNTEASYLSPEIHFTYAGSSDETVAAVSIGADGRAAVVPVGAGNTTVKLGLAASGSGAPMTADIAISVVAAELTRSMFTVDTGAETYDGTAKTKTVTSSTLTLGKDYTVAYSNNINAGTAAITITGKGMYSGTLAYNFTIDQAERSLTAALNPVQLSEGGPSGTVTLTDNAAADAPVYTYASSDSSVAAVSGGTVTPVGIGTATVTVSAPATANYKAGSAAVTVTVTALPAQDLSFAAGSIDKTYGDPAFMNAAANRTAGGGAITYTSSDTDVAVVGPDGKVTIKGAGRTVITATAAFVAGRYAETSVSCTLTVGPKAISIAGVAVADKVYDGTADTAVTGIAFDGVVADDTLTPGVDYTAAARFADAAAGSNKEVTVTVTLDNDNYTLRNDTIKTAADIRKAMFPTVSCHTTLRVEAGRTRELDLSAQAGWPDGLDGARFTAAAGSGAGLTAGISGTALTLTSKGTKTAGDTDTVRVTVSDAVNYENGTVAVYVTYTEKEEVTIGGITVGDKVYDGKAAACTGDITITSKSTGGAVTLNSEAVKYIWTELLSGSVLEAAPVNAGEYRLTVTVDDDNYEGELAIQFTVSKAALVVRPGDVTVSVGDALPEAFSLTYEGFVNGENADVLEMGGAAPSFALMNGEDRLENSDTAGTYKIEWTNKEAVVIDADNYQIQKDDGTLYIRDKLKITVSETSNGTVTVTPVSAGAGDKVTVTAAPDDGYTTGSVTVTDDSGSSVPVTDNGDGTYTFTMPGSDVTVNAAFVPIREEPSGTVATTTVIPGVEVSEDGTGAFAAVTESQAEGMVRDAVERNSGIVAIRPDMPEDVTLAEVTIPAAALTELGKKTGADVTVETPVGFVTIPNEALKELGLAGVSVSVSVEARNGGAVKIDVKVDGRSVETVGGGLKVALPTGSGQVAVHVGTYGSRTVIQKSLVEGGTAYVLLDGPATVKIVDGSRDFTDVGNNLWYTGAVDFASSHELFVGTGDGSTFSPNDAMTRAMLVTVLWRLEGKAEAGAGAINFADAESGAWYVDAMAWASAAKIVSGTGGNNFSPGRSITREELVTILYRYANTVGLDTDARAYLGVFADARSVSGWAWDAMSWAVAVGIIQGGDTGLDATGNASRAQVAIILQRLVGLMVK